MDSIIGNDWNNISQPDSHSSSSKTKQTEQNGFLCSTSGCGRYVNASYSWIMQLKSFIIYRLLSRSLITLTLI